MREYGKVHATFWSSETTQALSEDGQRLALYLLTCGHGTIAGVFRLPDGYVCEDLRWSPERVREGFAELLSNGFANRCETTKWVWVIKHFRWNQLDNPNQRKSAAKCAAEVPEKCSWKASYIRDCGGYFGLSQTPSSETVEEPFRNPSLISSSSSSSNSSCNSNSSCKQHLAAEEESTSDQSPDGDPMQTDQPADTAQRKTSGPPKRGHQLPDTWQPTDDHGDMAAALVLDIAVESASFRDYYRACGKPMKDWNAAFRNWLRNAKKYQGAGDARRNARYSSDERQAVADELCGRKKPDNATQRTFEGDAKWVD